jgi:hypothetical protein
MKGENDRQIPDPNLIFILGVLAHFGHLRHFPVVSVTDTGGVR